MYGVSVPSLLYACTKPKLAFGSCRVSHICVRILCSASTQWMTPVSSSQVPSSIFAHSSSPAPRPLLVLVFQSLHGPRLYHPHTGTHSPLTHSQRHSQRVSRVDCDRFAELGKKARVVQDFVSPPHGLRVPSGVGVGSCTVS